jgi:hypothetical protein
VAFWQFSGNLLYFSQFWFIVSIKIWQPCLKFWFIVSIKIWQPCLKRLLVVDGQQNAQQLNRPPEIEVAKLKVVWKREVGFSQ